jgi:uncharacterized protein YdbL (DUF1318 family)
MSDHDSFRNIYLKQYLFGVFQSNRRFFVWDVLFGIAALSLLVSCSIKPPEVRLTGEKTSLEKEILGTYHQMREDTWMVASTRGTEEKPRISLSPEKKRSLDALREQEFNRDDVEEFKKKGYVGEANDGTLLLKPSDELTQNPDTRKFVEEIITEENADRLVIMARVVELNDSLKRAVPKEVASVFAKMYQENSTSGTWIQKPDGDWIKK